MGDSFGELQLPPPDYLANESNSGGLVTSAVITVVVGAIFVGMRFYTRAYIVNALGPSDWAILVALVFSIGNSAGTIHQVQLGSIGRHFWTISREVFIEGMKTVYWTNLVYIITLVTVKLSILLLYLRILSTLFLHRLCYAVIALVLLLGGYSFISNVVPCLPIATFWDPLSHPGAWCWPNPGKWWTDIGVHLFTEVMILLLPMPFLISLSIPLRKKIGVVLLFAFGTIVIIVSVLRIPSIVAIGYSTDPSWDAVNIAIWSSIELNTAIVCACSMTLKPLVHRFFPRMFTHGYRHQGSVEDVAHGHHHGLRGRSDGRPATIGTRRQRRLPTDLALETIDSGAGDLPKMSSKASSGSVDVSTASTLSPLPMSPQREQSAV